MMNNTNTMNDEITPMEQDSRRTKIRIDSPVPTNMVSSPLITREPVHNKTVTQLRHTEDPDDIQLSTTVHSPKLPSCNISSLASRELKLKPSPAILNILHNKSNNNCGTTSNPIFGFASSPKSEPADASSSSSFSSLSNQVKEEESNLNNNSNPAISFSILPRDLRNEVFFWLSVKDLEVAQQVCKDWYSIAGSDIVWKHLYERNFGIPLHNFEQCIHPHHHNHNHFHARSNSLGNINSQASSSGSSSTEASRASSDTASKGDSNKSKKEELDEKMLFWAVKNNCYHAVRYLVTNCHRDILESSIDAGFSPLYRACQRGFVRIVKLLVEMGADNESKKGDGSTPLYIACQENRLGVVEYLLSKGANIESTFKTGFTSMYIASQKGHLNVVKLLVEKGAIIDAAAEHGATPLYIACQNGHLDVVKYLISRGANIEAKFKDGFTPIYIASQKGHKEIVSLLINSGANIESRGGDSTPIYVAAQNGHYDVVELLIKHKANVEAKYKGFYTPLYIAAQKGHVNILRLLLAHGADIEQKCSRGSTALYVSAQNGHIEVVKELIKHHADPNVIFDNNIKKRRPVDIARENGHSLIVEILTEYMGSINHVQESSAIEIDSSQTGGTSGSHSNASHHYPQA